MMNSVSSGPDESISAERFARSFANYGRHLAVLLGGKVVENGGISANNSGLRSEFRNLAVQLRRFDKSEIRDAARWLRSWYAEQAWTLWSVFELDASDVLNYRFSNRLMYCERSTFRRPPPVDGLVVQEVTDDAGVALFEEVRERAIVNSRIPSWVSIPSTFDSRILGHGHRRWIGYVGSVPVATAAGFDDDRFNMIKNVATLSEYRSHGIGAAMTSVAFSASNRPAMFDADPDAEAFHCRLGFSYVGTIHFWAPK